ncbi:hypothetical protein [Deinococcus maricopensis]|nr:hypothetical protein [Deinococcus maricopensis]
MLRAEVFGGALQGGLVGAEQVCGVEGGGGGGALEGVGCARLGG